MGGYEVFAWNAVAIGKNQVVAVGFGNGFVEYGAFAEAVVFVPYMNQVQAAAGFYLVYQGPGVVGGAIVGDYDGKVGVCLGFIAT